MKNCLILILNIILFQVSVLANTKCWIYFSAKTNTTEKPEELLAYFNREKISVHHYSNWLKAYSVSMDESQKEKIRTQFPQINIEHVKRFKTNYYESNQNYDLSLESLNGMAFISRNITGKGIKVGILDAGYTRADSTKTLKYLMVNKQIAATKDFVNPEKKDFYAKEYKGDSHGREVLKKMAGYDSTKKENIGLATGAIYYLGRTENADKELKIEEDNWIAGLEWLDSLGVKIVNTSLGYANLFDDAAENYSPEQMDGKTALCTKAAQIAVNQKGMILITSAGNEGSSKWKVVTAPADAPDVITVGATQKKIRAKISYSSIGVENSPYVKPDISCYSPNGTSFAAPVIAGLIVCMYEIDTNLTAFKIKEILQQSSHLAFAPNNYIGYGIPDCEKIYSLLNKKTILSTHQLLVSKNNSIKINIPQTDSVVIFQKSTKQTVISQSILGLTKLKRKHEPSRLKNKKDFSVLKIVKHKNSTFTTVDTGEKTFEIEWK